MHSGALAQSVSLPVWRAGAAVRHPVAPAAPLSFAGTSSPRFSLLAQKPSWACMRTVVGGEHAARPQPTAFRLFRDLNRNRIRVIEGLTFQGLDSLEVLKLQRNNISKLTDGAFWGLSRIHVL